MRHRRFLNPNRSVYGSRWVRSRKCACAGLSRKRRLVGMRWMREGEFLWNYAGVITDLTRDDVRHLKGRGSYARIIWWL